MAVPNTFAAATSAIPLANLDANFAYYDAAYSITGTATSFTGAVTLSTGTANGVPYLNASKVLTSGAVLTFDGNILSSTRFAGALNGTVGATTANTGAFTTLTTSSTVTLNGGTANGVAYLNGSKVLTTGSALKWDLTTLTATGSGSAGEVAIRTGDTASNTSYLTFGTTNYNRAQISVSGSALTEGYMAFTTFTGGSGAEAMRLTSSGLEVKQAQLIGYSSYSGLGSYGLAVAGNVGIGTSLPAGKLQVTSNNPEVYITDNSVSSPDSAALYLGIGVVTQYAGLIADFSNDLLKIRHNQATRATFDASGNLGLGVPPSASTSNYRTLQIGSTGVQYSLFGQRVGGNAETFVGWNAYGGSNTTGIGTGFYYTNSSDLASMYSQNGQHAWWIAPSGTADATISFTQAMTLAADGRLIVGSTSSNLANGGFAVVPNYDDVGSTGIEIGHASSAGTDYVYAAFKYNNTRIGSITQVGTTAVAYNTSSDYRLKNITGPITTSGAYIDSLKPVEGTWKADGSTFVGLIAHETQEVSRTTVATGTKDGADMQGMDYSSAEIIANLIAEIQDLRKRLAAAGIA